MTELGTGDLKHTLADDTTWLAIDAAGAARRHFWLDMHCNW